LAKLSLAAMVVAGLASSSFAADNLADAFKNGKVTGEIKAWYFDKTQENATKTADRDDNANIANFGLTLGFVTDSLYGFYAGATFQGSSTPFIDDDAKATKTVDSATFRTTNAASGATLSEAYLGYKIGKTNAKIGRQFISTPVVGGSSSRFFRESFEGVTVANTDIPQTTLIAAYVNKFQGRTSAVQSTDIGDAPRFHKSIVVATKDAPVYDFDGAYTLGLINKSVPNLTLTAQYAVVNDVTVSAAVKGDVDMYYTEANYVLPVAGFKLGFDANYRGSRTDGTLSDNSDLEGHMVAGRISIKDLAGFGASFAAATTSNNDHVILGVGNGPSTYTGTLIAGSATATSAADTDSYKFQVDYDFSKVGVAGLTAVAQYAWTEQGTQPDNAKGIDRTTYGAGVYYKVAALPGLTTGLEYEVQEAENKGATAAQHKKNDTDEMWFKASYKF
ncbi:MAG: outer membrane porin, OprD family, partial [Bacilli bacterium]|nr:outer membrane porin, OprD family [Bacilli bacterium]